MNTLIDHITGVPGEHAMTMELVQQAIDELQRALGEAFEIRERLKLKDSDPESGGKSHE